MHVLVIGCGLAGVTTAYFLRENGARVTVIDRQPGPARETSFANGSLITPSQGSPWNSPGVFGEILRSLGNESSPMLLRARALPSLAVWGLAFLRNASQARFESSFLNNVRVSLYSQLVMKKLLEKHALNFEHATNGTLTVFRSARSLEESLTVAHFLKQLQIRHRELMPDDLIELEPSLEPVRNELCGGIAYPADEVGNARLFCESLSEVAENSGVEFRFGEQVLRIEKRGKTVASVVTAREVIKADAYVLAAGSYSPALARPLGLRLPIRPAKGYSITLPLPEVHPRPRHAVLDADLHAAVVPLGDRLRVAGTAEFAGFDQAINPHRINNLVELLKRVYPEFPVDVNRMDTWTGLRPMTTDGMPILGASPLTNLYINSGHGPLGWTMACGSGKIVADSVFDEHSAFDAKPFGYERF